MLNSHDTQATALEIGCSIGYTLCRDAMWHEDRCNWFGPTHDLFMGHVVQAYGMLGPNLYDGTAGISLFLGQLGCLTGDPVVIETARAACRHSLSRVSDVPEHISFGFHTGHVGIAYAAISVGTLLGDEMLRSRGLALLERVLHRPFQGACILDVMVGFAGAIPAILAVKNSFGLNLDTEPLNDWGYALIAAADTCERGKSWDTTTEMRRSIDASAPMWMSPEGKRRPNLLGLAHGASGIGLALLELAATNENSTFRRAADEAFAYEESWFDAEAMCWPDLRHYREDGAKQTLAAWCHGAVGIGLSRIRAWELTDQQRYQTQALIAMRFTAETLVNQLQPGVNFCLCHGIAGNAEIFLNDSVGFGPTGQQLLVDVVKFSYETYHRPRRPWSYGESSEDRVPVGLMTGLAGTGYFFLRMTNPLAVRPALLVRGTRLDQTRFFPNTAQIS
jgi:lantibiotic modifying enzyme